MFGDPQFGGPQGGHHRITGALLDATHRAIALHPHPARKAAFAKILASLASEQAKDHASAGSGYAGSAGAAGQGGYGGEVAAGAQGPAWPMLALPHQRVFQPLLPEDNGAPLDGELIRPPGEFPFAHRRRPGLGGVQLPEPTGYPTAVPSISQAIAEAVARGLPPRY